MLHLIVPVMVMLLFKPVSIKAADVFVKGINLNGSAIQIDGNNWISYGSALSSGFSVSAISTFSNSITWSPAVDTKTNTMLNSVIYKSGGSFTMNQTIENGKYNVFFWLTENYADNARSADIKIEGYTVAKSVGKMLKNTWKKYGPYNMTVRDGILSIDFIRVSGDPQCAGLAIYSTDSVSIPVIDGWSAIEAENYSSSAFGTFQNNSTLLSENAGSNWVQYDSLDFYSATNYIQINVANGGENSLIQMVVNDKIVDTITVENTGSWKTFKTKTFKLDTPQSGVKKVKFVCTKNSADLDWFIFSLRDPAPPQKTSTYFKQRVINTTDLGADPDDEESLVHLMVAANEYDLEGLIVVTSCWKTTQNSTSMLDTIVEAYGKVLPNLEKHAHGFPSLAYIKSIVKLGQPGFGMAGVGEGKDSEGSDLIIASVDKDDPRPVWVNLWGGGNTLAQALWKVKATRNQAQVDQFISKLRVYDVLGQDDAGAWITKNFPELFYIRAVGVYGWAPSDSWAATNVQSHGPLGAVYPNRIWSLEGDTPAFLYQYPTGMNDPERVDWGSWGGRFNYAVKGGVRGMTGGEPYDEAQYDSYFMNSDAAEGNVSVSRWSTAFNNDFQARMDWSINNIYSGANHHPVAVLNEDTTKTILQIQANTGSSVTLSASGSSDPDGNQLTYIWSYYNGPGSYKGNVTIQNYTTANATLKIPADASDKTIHVILTVRDNGTPNLYAYRRVIINVLDSTATGISALKAENTIRIYPNPVCDVLNIKTEKEFNKLRIFNVEGKMILEKYYGENTKATSLQLNLKSGLYMLKLSDGNLSINSKFIVK